MMTIVVQRRLNWFYRNFRFKEFKVLSNISSGPAADKARYWKDQVELSRALESVKTVFTPFQRSR